MCVCVCTCAGRALGLDSEDVEEGPQPAGVSSEMGLGALAAHPALPLRQGCIRDLAHTHTHTDQKKQHITFPGLKGVSIYMVEPPPLTHRIAVSD